MNDEWSKLCRACLTTKESFTHFLTENVSTETYSFCTSIQVHKEDSLPKALCNSCHELIKRYSEFKKTCIESENTLLLCSKTVKAEHTLATTGNDEKEIALDIQNEFENVERKFDVNGYVKEEDLSEDFRDSGPELSDCTVQDIKSQKIKKLKHKLVKYESESIKKLQYSCKLCHKKFKYRKRYETHKLEHNVETENNLQCTPCNKTFITSSGLRRHVESAHAGVRLSSVACARCGRVCASKHSLRAHEKTHYTARKQAVCHVCGKRMSSAVVLRTHLETHKANRERRHTCEHCGKKFLSNTILLTHIKRLHIGLRFICGICGYPFTDKHNLAKHLLIHDGKKPYKCDLCDKCYATKGSLVEHKRLHSGERPFNCSFCPKNFISRRRLLDHHRIHTGDKPHRCTVCEQRFTQKGTLKRHMKVHDAMKAPLIT